MKPKNLAKLSVDILMILTSLFLMGYHFLGKMLHQWMGAGMFLLFVIHNIMNINWYRTLLKGRHNLLRLLRICIDFFVLIFLLIQFFSGAVMSGFLPEIISVSLARRLHIIGAYWGFISISLHLGLHWNMFLGIIKKISDGKNKSKNRSIIPLIPAAAICLYGLRTFIIRDFPVYMFLKTEFVFFDYQEPKILFYTEYIALMGLCIFISHYTVKFLKKFI